eukprot:CAMPEP_0198270542 /NCGR_PEP_ID=MMETSP1447-20131203/45456_1 /TAXON_ID=420782 /ORGANISM="Chaetoceros dichaeta, Strain CCMP1751" /LENGTH=75 /DNA_ID=CAMNT_0043962623 /DNA_START=402 /DNA_END=629 /DNA_ORIENTATION=+
MLGGMTNALLDNATDGEDKDVDNDEIGVGFTFVGDDEEDETGNTGSSDTDLSVAAVIWESSTSSANSENGGTGKR